MLPLSITAMGKAKFDWWQDWRGECVAIVASGASTRNANVSILRDRIHVVAVNTSIEKCPWADVLYGCDAQWWKLRRGEPKFAGLKISQDSHACGEFKDIKKIDVNPMCDELLLATAGQVGAGGNSGFQAVNLAAQFGVTAIALVGFDFQGEHWHGRHPGPLWNPNESAFRRWRKALDGAASKFRMLGIDVVNCSPVSSLDAYPKMTTEAALARWGL